MLTAKVRLGDTHVHWSVPWIITKRKEMHVSWRTSLVTRIMGLHRLPTVPVLMEWCRLDLSPTHPRSLALSFGPIQLARYPAEATSWRWRHSCTEVKEGAEVWVWAIVLWAEPSKFVKLTCWTTGQPRKVWFRWDQFLLFQTFGDCSTFPFRRVNSHANSTCPDGKSLKEVATQWWANNL